MKCRVITALTAAWLASVAWAEGHPPLNLNLPANDYRGYPAAAESSAAQPASASSSVNQSAVTVNGHSAALSSAPGVYYGDTSGGTAHHDTAASVCDDSTYHKAQVHGALGMGVFGGSHIGTGNYQSGQISVLRNMGSCDHPSGSVGISIGVSRFGGFGVP